MFVRFAFLGVQGRGVGREGNGSKGARGEEGKKVEGRAVFGDVVHGWSNVSTRRKVDFSVYFFLSPFE